MNTTEIKPMKITKSDLDVGLLKEVLEYNPITGELKWKTNQYSRRVVVGSRAGSVSSNGYRYVQIFGTNYAEHHLIWFIQTGQWSNQVIDHINHKRDDNRWENLREVSRADNMRNQSKRTNTLSGEQGIWYCKRRDRYIAELTYNGKKVLQRQFKKFDQALQAREEKLAELGFHENHGN